MPFREEGKQTRGSAWAEQRQVKFYPIFILAFALPVIDISASLLAAAYNETESRGTPGLERKIADRETPAEETRWSYPKSRHAR